AGGGSRPHPRPVRRRAPARRRRRRPLPCGSRGGGIMILDVPVDPDDDEARRWLEEELGRGDTPYSEPELPQWLQDLPAWLRDLLGGVDVDAPTPGADTGGTVGIIIAVVLVVAALVVAFAIFGLPRLRRRSRVTGDLFGDDDDRSAQQIRTAAQRAADA